ncbi:MAG TPA: hypothetical protein VF292_08365 [Rhodanobacteraceae bacterium]
MSATTYSTEDVLHEVFMERIGVKPRVPRDWDVVPRTWLAPRPAVRRPVPSPVTYSQHGRHPFPVLAALLVAVVGAASFTYTLDAITPTVYAPPVPARATQPVAPAPAACVRNAGIWAATCRELASINQ